MNRPSYENESYWNDLISQYINDRQPYVAWLDIEYHFWNYFKHCLNKGNRYFFWHPLTQLIESEFAEHTCILKKETSLFRARNDDQRQLWKEWNDYSQIQYTPKVIKRIESREESKIDTQKLWNDYNETVNCSQLQSIKKRIEAGFHGYDAKESSAPPPDKAENGRCNPKGVSYLYVALEEHTAVAEIRPHIKDTISIALLQPVRDLKLVNFDYDPTETVEGKDFLFDNIRRDFALINKMKTDSYLTTQYITALIAHLGYDGISFRSSLVADGTNYVIFDSNVCNVISSKLCFLSEVKYIFGECK